MADLLTWEDVKKELGTNCSVLLGNGFSRSYCNQAFNQYQILQHISNTKFSKNTSSIMLSKYYRDLSYTCWNTKMILYNPKTSIRLSMNDISSTHM